MSPSPQSELLPLELKLPEVAGPELLYKAEARAAVLRGWRDVLKYFIIRTGIKYFIGEFQDQSVYDIMTKSQIMWDFFEPLDIEN